ncbi:MAG: hypothetical protein S0880_27720 [Actinomycetota bacterium]|nr:hypothetical protein [Actinomycetota bacterium]
MIATEPTAADRSRALAGAAGLAVIAAASLWLGWWRSAGGPVGEVATIGSTWTGVELAGTGRTALLVAAAAVTLVLSVAARRGHLPEAAAAAMAAASGAASVVTAVAVLVEWGRSDAIGAWVALSAGAGAVVVGATVAVRGRRAVSLDRAAIGVGFVIAATVVSAAVLEVRSVGPSVADRADEPFVAVADVNLSHPVRAGGRGLGVSSSSRLAESDGRTLVLDAGVVLAVDDDGRTVVVRDEGTTRGYEVPAGTHDDLLVEDLVHPAIRDLRTGAVITMLDTRPETVVGDDGTILLGDGASATTDETTVLERVDLDALRQRLDDGAELTEPPRTEPVDVAPDTWLLSIVPRSDGYLSVENDVRPGSRLRFAGYGEPGEQVAGTPDPACGLTNVATSSFLTDVRAEGVTGDGDGGWWVAVKTEPGFGHEPSIVVHLGADGVMRRLPGTVGGEVRSMVVRSDGALAALVVGDDTVTLVDVPDAASHLVSLPDPPAGCVAAIDELGPPVGLAPVPGDTAGADGEPPGTVLGVDGRRVIALPAGDDAAGVRLYEIVVLDADGNRRVLGTAPEGSTTSVVPDGRGGVWWFEPAPTEEAALDDANARDEDAARGSTGTDAQDDGDTNAGATIDADDADDTVEEVRLTMTPVHAPAGDEALRRFPPVTVTSSSQVIALPDLTGGVPLLATSSALVRPADGATTVVLDETISAGLVTPNGQLVVATTDGRLLTAEPDGSDTHEVVTAATDDEVPVALQVVRGATVDEVTLQRPSVGVDADGNALVISDDVVLAVDGTEVALVAQDERLAGNTVVPVDGGSLLVGPRLLLDVAAP